MSELSDMYQEVILDHNKSPRNFKKLDDATHSLEGYNPLCGDKLTIYLRLEDNVIEETSFVGSGCAISKASASMMTHKLKGLTTIEAEQMIQNVHQMLTGKITDELTISKLGNLAALSGVCKFPTRVKCATLAWHTFKAALAGADEKVSTE